MGSENSRPQPQQNYARQSPAASYQYRTTPQVSPQRSSPAASVNQHQATTFSNQQRRQDNVPATSRRTTCRPEPASVASQYNYTSEELRSFGRASENRLYPNLHEADRSQSVIPPRAANLQTGENEARTAQQANPQGARRVDDAGRHRRAQESQNSNADAAVRFAAAERGGVSQSTSHSMNDYVFVNRSTSISMASPSAPEEDLLSDASSTTSGIRETRDKENTCPTCDDIFGEHIYQCVNGHSACHRCRGVGRCCRQCGSRDMNMRNFALEELVRNRRLPCPNTVDGCKMKLPRADLADHMKECIYRVMDCPLAAVYGLCTWKGRRGDDMIRHFDERHGDSRRVTVNEEAFMRRPAGDARYVHLVTLEYYFFIVHIKISEANETLRMAVQVIGTKTGAAKWKYEINFYNKAEPRRKLTFHGDVTSDRENIDAVFSEMRCLTLPLEYVQGLCNDRGLNYKFFITRQDSIDNRKPRQRTHWQNKQRKTQVQ